MRQHLLSLFLLAATITLTIAQDYSLQIGNVAWQGDPGGYNCFSSIEYPNTVNFTLTTLGRGNNSYVITIGPSNSTGNYNRQLSSGPNRLSYQLYITGTASILKAFPDATPDEVISGKENARIGSVWPLNFTLVIPPNQVVEPGTYTDQITVSVYSKHNDNKPPMDTRIITIRAVVVSGAMLSVVSSGSSFSSTTTSQNLDFGTLLKGDSRTCDLLVRKNTRCNITFSSLNNGVMKAIPIPTDDYVPYTCTVNNSALNLANPALITLPAGVSPSQDGNRLPITITIGDPDEASAGDYQDEITITVKAL